MHEWALAEAVVEAAAEAAVKERWARLTAVRVGLGELQQVDRPAFAFALAEISRCRGAPVERASFELQTEAALFRCRPCRQTWGFAESGLGAEERECIHFLPEVAHVYLRCPECGSPDFEVAAGRGVSIMAIVGEEES